MAWLQNLADHAENILNKIDQGAATVLHENIDNIEEVKKQVQLQSPFCVEKNINLNNEHTKESYLNNTESNLSVSKHLEPVDGADTNLEAINISEKDNVNINYPPEGLNEHPRITCFEKPTVGLTSSKSSGSLNNSFTLNEDTQVYIEKLQQLELDYDKLNKELLNLQHLYLEVRNENASLRSQMEASNNLVTAAQSEMEHYKARSQRILQEKEELIAMKNQNSLPDDSDNLIFIKYNDELRKELEFQQNINSDLLEKSNKLMQEKTYLQQQLVMIQHSSQTTSHTLHQKLLDEKKVRMMIEEECRLKNQDLQVKTQELQQQYNVIKMQNDKINNLKDILKTKKTTNVNDDFDSRIKALTETLMLKQHSLESITTERNALRIQLEQLEKEYHKNLTQLERVQVRVININDTDDVKSQVPHFMRVSPLDAGVTRRVKHAYSTVDAISVRTGIFLRRYPLARVFVFCYMVILQLWVLVILFYYAPSNR